MTEIDIVKILRFEKKAMHGVVCCEMRVYRDGSAYICGDEIEVGFDDAPEAWMDALPYLASLGYKDVAEER
jgi:hypothetical protein